MGIFRLFKKEKTETEKFYEEKEREKRQWEAQYTGENFRIVVQDVFMITGRGTVIVGEIESGTITVGEKVILRKQDGTSQEVVVTGIEMFRKILEIAHQGDHVGLLLRGLEKHDVHKGDILEK